MSAENQYPPQLRDKVLKDRHVCRVFLSSPFLGIEKERQELTKLLPRLSQLCRLQGVELTVVDMRWGISSESASEARTVFMCLQELDRSDIFVGFFAQRYGWHGVNDQALQNNYDLASEVYPWIDDYRDRSITEIEFLRGHLLEPGKTPSIFCFRDPEYDLKMGSECSEKAWAFKPESHVAKEKLELLKGRVLETEDSCVAVKESYKSPQEMAEYTFQCLYTYIKNVLLPNTALKKGNAEMTDPHDVFRISRCRIYIGKKNIDLLEQMTKETNRIVVHGDTGCGKSALVCNWLTGKISLSEEGREDKSGVGLQSCMTKTNENVENTKSGDEPEDNDNGQPQPEENAAVNEGSAFIYHAVGGAPSSSTVVSLLSRLITKLVDLEPGIRPSTEPKALDDYVITLNNMLLRLGDRRVVIIVDGVDKLQTATKAQKPLFWVPVTLPSNVALILTMVTSDSLNLEIAKDKLGQRELRIEPLTMEEKTLLVSDILRDNSKELSREEMALVLEATQTSNPLYLSIFMKELCTVDYYRKVGAKIQELLGSSDVTGLFNSFIRRLELDYCTKEFPTVVKDVLTVIQIVKLGIRVGDLTDLLSLPSSVWVPIQYSLLPYLLDSQGYLTYEFPELQTAVYSRYLDKDEEYCVSIKRKAGDFMWRTYLARRNRGVRQEFLLLNSMDLYYQLGDKTNIRLIFHDAVSFQRLFQIDHFQCVEYWQKTQLIGRQTGQFICEAADAYYSESGDLNSVLEFLDHCITFLGTLMNYSAKEIVLYKAQKLTRECRDLSDNEMEQRLDRIHYLLANLYSTVDQTDVSISLHQKLLEKRRNSPESMTSVGRLRIADSLHGLAMEYAKTKKNTEVVLDLYNQAIELYDDDEDKIAGTTNNIALILIDAGRYKEAQESLEKIIEKYDREHYGEPPTEYGAIIMNLAVVHRKQGNLDQAEELYNKAMEINVRLLGKDHILVGKNLLNLINVKTLRNDLPGAAGVAEKALEIFLGNLDEKNEMCLLALENCAECHRKLKNFDKAEQYFWRAFELRLKNGTVSAGLRHLYQGMIEHHVNRKEYDRCAKILIAVFDLYENRRYCGILAICDYNTTPRPVRDKKYSLDEGIKRYPTELFNLLYKFKFEIMTEGVTFEQVKAFCRYHHERTFLRDGSFLLSVATWLFDDYQKYYWAANLILITSGFFKNEANVTALLVRIFHHFSSQAQKDYVAMIPLIERIIEVSAPNEQNYISCCKICALGARTDLARQYSRTMEDKWPDSHEVRMNAALVRIMSDEIDAALAAREENALEKKSPKGNAQEENAEEKNAQEENGPKENT